MTNEVLISNLPWNASGADVAGFCKTVGPVEKAKVMVHPATGRSRGQALVVFESVNDAVEAARALSGQALLGKAVTVTVLDAPYHSA